MACLIESFIASKVSMRFETSNLDNIVSKAFCPLVSWRPRFFYCDAERNVPHVGQIDQIDHDLPHVGQIDQIDHDLDHLLDPNLPL